MGAKLNYALGAVTIGLIIGGTIYAIKKSKDAEQEEEESISLEEARKIVKERDRREQADETTFMADIDEVVEEEDEEYYEPVRRPYEEEEEDYSYEVDGDPEYDKYPTVDENTEGPSYYVEPLNDFNYYEDGINPKEDKTLRFGPDSVEAKHQYIRMELAEWNPADDTYRIMIQLFEFPFTPTNDGDEILRTQIIDHKMQFFGRTSKWNREVSFADVIFHYARLAEFNCGETVAYWVDYFLEFNDFYWDSTSHHFDTLIMRLNNHNYFNEERQTFGLFGLTRNAMDQAIRTANRNIDRSVTYEIEFNEFLKSCI